MSSGSLKRFGGVSKGPLVGRSLGGNFKSESGEEGMDQGKEKGAADETWEFLGSHISSRLSRFGCGTISHIIGRGGSVIYRTHGGED